MRARSYRFRRKEMLIPGLKLLSVLAFLTSCRPVDYLGDRTISEEADLPETSTPTVPMPTHTATETATPTPMPTTPLTATVWEQDPITVVLTYHQFAANHAKQSTSLKVRFEDFESQLNQLYDAGFSLVTLEDWLAGNIVVPPGRRPLILSLDDLYFNNQIRLDDAGSPLPDTGLGILYYFSQEHPDFGYSAALFVNLGNKLYANPDDPGWETELAKTIAWGIDHDLMPYNHFYTHPQLDRTSGEIILWELKMNDDYLRQLLGKAGREDLIPRLDNIIALTYGVWPRPGDDRVMLRYENPEGEPVRVVAEIEPISLEKYLEPPYSPQFDPFHLPRHVASPSAVDFLVANAEKFPTAEACDLGQVPNALFDDPEVLAGFIAQAALANGCPDGVYIAAGSVFRITAGSGEVLEIE